MFKNRKYVSGTTSCFWRWTEVDSEYITRLHILKTPWFAICIHWLNKPDPEPYLHDHPVSFLSLILRGDYSERTPTGIKTNRFFRWFKATDKHTICNVVPGTVTICFMGPKVREWGFWTEDGWIFWKDYYKRNMLHHMAPQ